MYIQWTSGSRRDAFEKLALEARWCLLATVCILSPSLFPKQESGCSVSNGRCEIKES